MRRALHYTESDFIQIKSFRDLRLDAASYHVPGQQSPPLWIEDLTGKPQLQFVVGTESLTLYAGPSISLITFVDWLEFKVKLPTFIANIKAGKWYCGQCNKFKSQKRFKHFSFAGIVCDKCYDPNFHRPPDTRGD